MPEHDDGRWYYKTDRGPGTTVRVEEMLRVGGNVHVKIWDPEMGSSGGYRTESLGFPVRDEQGELMDEPVQKAIDRARAESDALEKADTKRVSRLDRTLGTIADLYSERELPHLATGRTKRIERDVEFLEQQLGRDFPLGEAMVMGDIAELIRQRRSGELDARGNRVPKPDDRKEVTAGTAAKPFKTLRTLCRWATRQRVSRNGTRELLLPADPTSGLEFPDGRTPDRPYYSDEECEALLSVAPRVVIGRSDRVGEDEDAVSYMPTLLTLAMETGRRISSIVALRWSDWLPDRGTHGALRWRAEEDKIGEESVVPVTEAAARALETHRREVVPGVGRTPIFPAPRSEGHVSRDLAGGWLVRTERLTRETDDVRSVEHVDGRGWHGFRRRWAIKRKHLPVQDVADAGGWKGIDCLQTIYQQADPITLQDVVDAGDEKRLVR